MVVRFRLRNISSANRTRTTSFPLPDLASPSVSHDDCSLLSSVDFLSSMKETRLRSTTVLSS